MAFLLVPLAGIGGFITFVGLMMDGAGDKRDIADMEHPLILRVNGSSIERKYVHMLHGLTANFTSAETAIFNNPAWAVDVKALYHIDLAASKAGLIRGDLSFELPQTITVRETTTNNWIESMFDGEVANQGAKGNVVNGQFVTYHHGSKEGRALKEKFVAAYERREEWQD